MRVQKEGKCYYCNVPVDINTATMDHIVPLSKGGKSTKANLAVCCKKCNTDKKNTDPFLWMNIFDD